MSHSDLRANVYLIVPFVAATAATGLAVIDPFRLALGPVRYSGLGVVAVGVGLVGWVVRTVGRAGETLSPVTTPDRLVVIGAFAHTRNPMYLGVLLVVVGVSIVGSSPVAGGYALLHPSLAKPPLRFLAGYR
jgi:protein-S-isoprenylcysteine O-methyltransferase Ste14